MATLASSNRRATWRARMSIAPAVSVVSSTSRVRSNSRVTSFRRAIASRARSCAAAERLLAMTATTRKANNAIQFCGSAIVNVPTGGRKKKLSVSIARSETTIAVLSRRERRGAKHNQQKRQRRRRRADVGQRLSARGDRRDRAEAAAGRRRARVPRDGETSAAPQILPPAARPDRRSRQLLMDSLRLSYGDAAYGGAQDAACTPLRRSTAPRVEPEQLSAHHGRLSGARTGADLSPSVRHALRSAGLRAGRRRVRLSLAAAVAPHGSAWRLCAIAPDLGVGR